MKRTEAQLRMDSYMMDLFLKVLRERKQLIHTLNHLAIQHRCVSDEERQDLVNYLSYCTDKISPMNRGELE